MGRKPGSPTPFDMGGVPNRPRRPRKQGDKGCAVTALAMLGGFGAATAGLVYGAVEGFKALF